MQSKTRNLAHSNTILNELRSYQKALEINEKRFIDIAEASGAFIWEIDAQFRFTYLTPNIANIMGYTPDDLIKKSFFTISKNESAEKMIALFSKRASNKEPFNEIEMEASCPNDNLTWLRITGLPILNEEEDTLVGYRGAATDISLNKLQAVSLEAAYHEAEKAATARSNFLAMMSHEIRTPLNGIIGLSSLLRESNLTPDQFDYAIRIERSGQHLLQLLNDILDYSKLDAGEFDLEDVIFQLSEQIDTSIDIASSYLEKKPVLIETNILPAIPKYLKGDTARLRQVLVNLIGNAAKFTNEGKIIVSVSYVEEKENMITLRFDIKDTGIGIPEDALETLFDKFTQVSNRNRTSQGGTGLGLAICREIVTIMGGEIGVESTLGEGSLFWFTAVLNKPNTEEIDQEHNHKYQPDLVHQSNTIPMRILVAEDSINNQILIQKMLEKRGHSVNIVANGIEAIKAVESFPYDLVFMDIQMPELDGIEATKAIRQLKSTKKSSIPIIALTADAIAGAKEKYLKVGMNDYLKKPIDTKHFDRMLGQWGAKKEDKCNKTAESEEKNDMDECHFINHEQFKQLVDEIGKHDLLEAYDVLWKNIAKDIDQLKKAIEKDEVNEIRAHAHKIKGTAASFAAEALSDCAYQIESNASDRQITRSKVDKILQVMDQTKAAIQNRLA